MKFNLLNRKIHYWASFAVAVPILVIIVSGLFLQTKKQFTWIQPAEVRGVGKTPTVSMDRILEVSKSVPEANISGWEDINRLDVRPSKGMVKVRAENDWEIQIDLQTGEILQTAYRRSDFIESIHDGSYFHDNVKLWIFLPSGIVLLALWLTGIYMFVLPYWVRSKRKRPQT